MSDKCERGSTNDLIELMEYETWAWSWGGDWSWPVTSQPHHTSADLEVEVAGEIDDGFIDDSPPPMSIVAPWPKRNKKRTFYFSKDWVHVEMKVSCQQD